MTDCQQQWLLGALIVVATLGTYGPALNGDFLWDDEAHVRDNTLLDSWGGLVELWTNPKAIPARQNYPLTFTSFWIEKQLFGDGTFHYHLINVLLHCGSALLLWRLLRRLQGPAPWLAAAVFALHPVEVESVAWISERKNTLSGFLYLASLWFFITRSKNIDIRVGVSLALFVLALLAKTIACSLPVTLLLIAWWKQGKVTASDVAVSLPYFVIGLILAINTGNIEAQHVGAIGATWDISLVERTEIAARAWWFYLGKVALPVDLNFIYPRFAVPARWAWGLVAAGLAVLGLLWARRGTLGRGPLTAVLYFSAAVFPALGFVMVYPFRFSFVADHFQYLATIGTIVLGVAGLDACRRRMAWTTAAWRGVCSVLLMVLAGLSFQQCQAFGSPTSLWNHTLALNPQAWIAENNLGMIHVRAGRLDQARTHFERALEIDPSIRESLSNLASVLGRLGWVAESKARYQQLVNLHPRNYAARVGLAQAYKRLQEYGQAIEHCEVAIGIQADRPDAYSILGESLLALGRHERAVESLESVLRYDPGRSAARVNLSRALAGLKRFDEAEEQVREAIRRDPEFQTAYNDLAILHVVRGRLPEAIVALSEAIRLKPRDTVALKNLGRVYSDSGDHRAAIRTYEKLLEFAPGLAHELLVQAHLDNGSPDEAARHLSAAEKLGRSIPQSLRDQVEKRSP